MSVNYLAVFAAGIAGWLVGALWYRILAKPWAAAAGLGAPELEGSGGRRKMRVTPMVYSFVAILVMAYMLAGVMGDIDGISIRTGLIAGGLAWLGFVITTLSVNNAFANRKSALTVIDGGYWLATLLIQGVVIGAIGP